MDGPAGTDDNLAENQKTTFSFGLSLNDESRLRIDPEFAAKQSPREGSKQSPRESNDSKNRLKSLGLYAGSTIPRELHLALSREEIHEFGKEILQSMRFSAPDPEDVAKGTSRRAVLMKKIDQKIQDIKYKVHLVEGGGALSRFYSSSREARRLKAATKKYEKDPLCNPDYIKRATANP